MAHRPGAEVVRLDDDHDVFLAAPKAYVAASLEAIARVTT